MPIFWPCASAVSRADSAIPKTGRRVAARISVSPGSEKQALTKAATFSSKDRASLQRGAITDRTSASLSIPDGPSARVKHFIFGPS